jgi:hypothetical protein
MLHNHNNHSYPANKMTPIGMFKRKNSHMFFPRVLNGVVKRFHTRKSRQWLKRQLEKEVENV